MSDEIVTYADFTDGPDDPIFFVSTPNWSCNYSPTNTSFGAGLSFTAYNVFIMSDPEYHCRLKVVTNGKTYYSADTTPDKYSSGNGHFNLSVTISGLSASTAYECTMTIQWRSTNSSTWYDHKGTYGAVGYTTGSPPPFRWDRKNYSNIHIKTWGDDYEDTGFPTTESHLDGSPIKAYFNASDAQVKKAYNALTNGGLISDFSTSVWNDILDRITWVQREWGVRDYNTIWKASPQAYISYDSPEWQEKPVPGNMLTKYPGKAITAYKFNRAVQAIATASSWPWEKELGRKEIKPSDLCKGSYFIALVDALNHWISLVPLPIVINGSFSQSMSGKSTQLPSAPIDSSGKFGSSFNFDVNSIPGIQVAHSSSFKLTDNNFDLIVENGSISFGSQFNFFDFNAEMCKAASVTAYVMGDFTGNIQQPAHAIDIGFADTLIMQSTGQIPAIKESIDLTSPIGCVIGEYSYTLHTKAQFQIGSASSFYLEHNGIFGVVNKFTLTPRDNDQSVLNGTIGISGTLDEMLTEPGSHLEYENMVQMSEKLNISSSVGNVMVQDNHIRVSGVSDFTVSTIVPLEFSGNAGFSATVDNLKASGTYEIPGSEVDISITAESEIEKAGTISVSAKPISIGVSAVAENNANDPVEMEGNINVSIEKTDATLSGQKNAPISSAISATISAISDVGITKQEAINSEVDISITAESVVRTNKPVKAESSVEIDESGTGELVYRPFIPVETPSVIIKESEFADVSYINRAKTRIIEVDTQLTVNTDSELTAEGKLSEIIAEHSITVHTESDMNAVVPHVINAAETIKTATSGAMDRLYSKQIKNESEIILVRSEATLSMRAVSLTLASELENTLTSKLDDRTVDDVERTVIVDE